MPPTPLLAAVDVGAVPFAILRRRWAANRCHQIAQRKTPLVAQERIEAQMPFVKSCPHYGGLAGEVIGQISITFLG